MLRFRATSEPTPTSPRALIIPGFSQRSGEDRNLSRGRGIGATGIAGNVLRLVTTSAGGVQLAELKGQSVQ